MADNSEKYKEYYRKYGPNLNLRIKIKRSLNPGKYLLNNYRVIDKRKGRENDLDLEFVCEAIKKACSYCGESSIKMSLDRIDNSKGHLKTNVVPACVRCNFMRRDMPYDAWLFLVPVIKKAVEQGIFGSWTGATRKGEEGLPSLESVKLKGRPRQSSRHGDPAWCKRCKIKDCMPCFEAKQKIKMGS